MYLLETVASIAEYEKSLESKENAPILFSPSAAIAPGGERSTVQHQMLAQN